MCRILHRDLGVCPMQLENILLVARFLYILNRFGSYQVSEGGNNVLHAMVLGASFKLKSQEEYSDILWAVVASKYCAASLRQISIQENHLSLRPCELAAFLGLLKISEELLHLSDLHVKQVKLQAYG